MGSTTDQPPSSAQGSARAGFFGRRARRLRGALALDSAIYEEIADEPAAIRGAVISVVVATLLAGAGTLLWTQWSGATPANAIYEPDLRRLIARAVIAGGMIQVGMWFVWVAVAKLYLWAFGSSTAYWRLARAMGYAFAPVGLQLFIAPPGFEFAVGALALGWALAASIAGVKAAARVTSGQALVAVCGGFLLFAVALGSLGDGTRDLAPGVFPLDPLFNSIGQHAK